MTRISRIAALSAAAVLALGIAACSPPHQKNSDAPQITTVSPEAGYEGAGTPQSSTSGSAEATEATEVPVDALYSDGGAVLTTEEPVAR